MQNELNAVKDKDELAELMKKNGCEAAVEEFVRVLSAEPEAEGEISDNSAESAAGGFRSVVEILRYVEAKSAP